MPVTPYTGQFGRVELKHLLQRSLYGCTLDDLAYFQGWTLDQVVDGLLNFSNDTTPPLKTYWRLNGTTRDPSIVDPAVPWGTTWINTPNDQGATTNATSERVFNFLSWRTNLLVHQDRTLREKLTMFWFNHMPVEAGTVFSGSMLYSYDQLLRSNCKGNFRQLMYNVSISPAMLVYLNGALNSNVAPDENFGRELLELFTLGEGNGYTEADVQAAARVMTGWTIRQQIGPVYILPEVVFEPILHETANKTFSSFFNNTVIQGQSGAGAGATELNAMLDMIFSKEEVSVFICRQLYRFFVHGDIDAAAESQLIAPLAELFRANAGAPDQIRIVVKAMLTSQHFFTQDLRNCMVMPPTDVVIGMIRKFRLPMPNNTDQLEARYTLGFTIAGLLSYCGQLMYDPPNVAGWPAYYQYPAYDDLWLDTATYPARYNTMLGILFNGFTTDGNFYQASSRNLTFKSDLVALVAQFSDPANPNAVVDEADDYMLATPASQAIHDDLKQNILLLGQMSDIYWSDAWTLYYNDPNTTNGTAMLVPSILLWLFSDFVKAAESQLH